MELVGGIATAGVGTGIAVYVARTSVAERQQDLAREALRIGLAVTGIAAASVMLGAPWTAVLLSGGRINASLVALAAGAGWLSVIAAVQNGLWLGQQRRERMLLLAAGSAALPLAAALLAPMNQLAMLVVLAHAAPGLALLLAMKRPQAPPRFRTSSHPLRRYVLPGLAIGILSPLSMLVARAAIGEGLSWQDAGVLQALWRVADWVCGIAAGVLAVYFLPRFAARGDLMTELVRAAKWVLIPAAAVFAALFMMQEALLAALYDDTFRAPPSAVALLFAGSLVRIASWIPLFALYALRRTRAIALGELLSLPLFASLTVLATQRLSLTLTAGLWLASFAAYLAFNFWAARRT